MIFRVYYFSDLLMQFVPIASYPTMAEAVRTAYDLGQTIPDRSFVFMREF